MEMKMEMVQTMTSTLLTILLIFSSLLSLATATTYNVVTLGAKGDGTTDSTNSFLSAWAAACGSASPATIYVPQGRYFLAGTTTFNGNQCKNNAITFNIAGTLVAPSNYNAIGNSENWIVFEGVTGVSISGGTLDGQGAGLWACKASSNNCPSGATSLEISNSNNVVISGLTSLNSQMFHIVIFGSNNVNLQGVHVSAPGNSPNTDGIHVSQSSGVTILNSKIGTGDDCISVGPGTTNTWIEDITCGPGHGISIGSLGQELQEAGVKNVTVKTSSFTGTQNGLRIKTFAKPSNGFVTGVLFQHATMTNVQNPIIIDQNYCGSENCPNGASGVQISDVSYQDIHGSSDTEVAVNFDCSKERPCSKISLEDVALTYMSQPAQASCANAGGSAYGYVEPTSCL